MLIMERQSCVQVCNACLRGNGKTVLCSSLLCMSGSAELVIQRRLWNQLHVSEFRYRGSLNYETIALFTISALTETIGTYERSKTLTFTKDLPVEISFLPVEIPSNGFGICSLHGPEPSPPYAYTVLKNASIANNVGCVIVMKGWVVFQINAELLYTLYSNWIVAVSENDCHLLLNLAKISYWDFNQICSADCGTT